MEGAHFIGMLLFYFHFTNHFPRDSRNKSHLSVKKKNFEYLVVLEKPKQPNKNYHWIKPSHPQKVDSEIENQVTNLSLIEINSDVNCFEIKRNT